METWAAGREGLEPRLPQWGLCMCHLAESGRNSSGDRLRASTPI